MTDKLESLRTLLTDVHEIMQQRLADIGAKETPHILIAIGPNGMAIIRANMEPEELKAISEDLGSAADAAMQGRPNGAPLN